MHIVDLFFFKQKTAYEMRISDWSSDVCSADLVVDLDLEGAGALLDRHCGDFARRGQQQFLPGAQDIRIFQHVRFDYPAPGDAVSVGDGDPGLPGLDAMIASAGNPEALADSADKGRRRLVGDRDRFG